MDGYYIPRIHSLPDGQYMGAIEEYAGEVKVGVHETGTIRYTAIEAWVDAGKLARSLVSA